MSDANDGYIEAEGKALGMEGRVKLYRMIDMIAVLTFVVVCVHVAVIYQHMDENRAWSRAMVLAIREQSCMQRYDQSERIKHLAECQQESRIP